jgi:2-amino-4-hydroxy-6-hydroxymethyldihydropteridine diphosphokinase
MKTVYISLGSNVGDRAANIAGAVAAMNAAGIHVLRVSSLYETEPVDAPPQQWFLNAVAQAETELMPRALLGAIREIERTFGRKRIVPRGPRTLDLDILLYGTSVIQTEELQVPHPRMAARRFVLVPMAEIASAVRHPVLHKTMTELLAETPDKGQIRRRPDGVASEVEPAARE